MSTPAPSPPASHAFSYMYFVSAFLTLLLGLGKYWHAQSLLHHLGEQTATVTSIHENIIFRKSMGWMDSLHCQFIVNGQTYTATTERQHGAGMVGDSLRVIYDDRDPGGTGFIGSPAELGSSPQGCFWIAGVCLLMGALFWFLPARRRVAA